MKSSIPVFVYNANTTDGVLVGVAIKGVESPSVPAWRTVIPKNEKILKIINNRYGNGTS